jgi:hypothetical protein
MRWKKNKKRGEAREGGVCRLLQAVVCFR